MNNDQSLKSVDQWIALNQILIMYKIIGISMSLSIVILSIYCIFLNLKPPIVIVEKNHEREFYKSKKGSITIRENDIANFLIQYTKLRHTWKGENISEVIKNITPLSTEGLASKVENELNRELGKEVERKQVEQTVANIVPTITEKHASVTFDKIIKIKGVPIIVQTQEILTLVKGDISEWNPMGLYVKGIIQHSGN